MLRRMALFLMAFLLMDQARSQSLEDLTRRVLGTEAVTLEGLQNSLDQLRDHSLEQNWFLNYGPSERNSLFNFGSGQSHSLGSRQNWLSEGGSNSSGGGGALACFSSRTEAESAVDSRGRVKRDQIRRIRHLEVFDFHEAERLQSEPSAPYIAFLPNETPERYVERVLFNHYFDVSPLLVENLLLLKRIIPFEKWIANDEGLAVFNDSGLAPADLKFSSPSLGHCRYVQLAMRYAKSNGQKIEKLEVHFDAALVQRMRELLSPADFKMQMAFISLHEWIYTLAREIGKSRSNEVRALTALFLSEKTLPWIRDPRGKENLYVWMAELGLSSYSGVLEELHRRMPEVSSRPPKGLMLSVWNQYKKKIETANADKIEDFVRARGGKIEDLPPAQSDELIFELHNFWQPQFMLLPAQTEAEAFIHLAGPLTHQGVISNPEIFIARSVDHSGAFSRACAHLRRELEAWRSESTEIEFALREAKDLGQFPEKHRRLLRTKEAIQLHGDLTSKALRFCAQWKN